MNNSFEYNKCNNYNNNENVDTNSLNYQLNTSTIDDSTSGYDDSEDVIEVNIAEDEEEVIEVFLADDDDCEQAPVSNNIQMNGASFNPLRSYSYNNNSPAQKTGAINPFFKEAYYQSQATELKESQKELEHRHSLWTYMMNVSMQNAVIQMRKIA